MYYNTMHARVICRYIIINHYDDTDKCTTAVLGKYMYASCGCVLVSPRVSLVVPEGAPFYMHHDIVVLECVSVGIPTPGVYWMWQECSTVNCSIGEAEWENITVCPNGHNIAYSNCANSQLWVAARVSGFFQCTGINKVGSDSKHERFVATGNPFTCVELIPYFMQAPC